MKQCYMFAGVSILFWSTMATVSKLLLGTMSSYQVLCISSALAFLALLIYNVVSGKISVMKSFSVKDYFVIALIGLPGPLSYNLLYYSGASVLLASQAFIINYLWPIMSVLFACILLREKLTPRKTLAFVFSFLGVLTVAGGGLLHFEEQTLLGMLLCMCAAISYGAYTALNQRWSYDKQIVVMFSYGITFAVCVIINLIIGTPLQITPIQVAGLTWNGIFVMAIANTTWVMALDCGNTAKISNLAYITPFLSLVWTFLVLHEVPSIWAIGGLCLIVLGIFVQLKDNK